MFPKADFMRPLKATPQDVFPTYAPSPAAFQKVLLISDFPPEVRAEWNGL